MHSKIITWNRRFSCVANFHMVSLTLCANGFARSIYWWTKRIICFEYGLLKSAQPLSLLLLLLLAQKCAPRWGISFSDYISNTISLFLCCLFVERVSEWVRESRMVTKRMCIMHIFAQMLTFSLCGFYFSSFAILELSSMPFILIISKIP